MKDKNYYDIRHYFAECRIKGIVCGNIKNYY